MIRKNWMFILLMMVVVIVIAGCSNKTTTLAFKDEETYKIGVNLELSGPSSVWGVPQKNAIEMLANDINEKGGIHGKKIKLVIYDNESSETQSLVVTKKLIEQDNVLAIIGGGSTPTTMPVLPYVTKKEVPVISTGSGDAIVEPTKERKWIFKTPSNNNDISVSIANFLLKQNKKKIAFMSLSNAYGESGYKAFETVAKEKGIEIVAVEKFGLGDKDMKPQLTRIKGKNPDAIVVWSIPPAASIVNRNYWELKMDQPLIFSAGAGVNAFVDLAGKEAAEGTYIASGKVWVVDQLKNSDPQREVLTNYVNQFNQKYKDGASPIDGMAYDALLLITKAIEESGKNVTQESIRSNLEKISKLPGITGIYNLSEKDHQGLKSEDIIMIKVKDGKWTIAE